MNEQKYRRFCFLCLFVMVLFCLNTENSRAQNIIGTVESGDGRTYVEDNTTLLLQFKTKGAHSTDLQEILAEHELTLLNDWSASDGVVELAAQSATDKLSIIRLLAKHPEVEWLSPVFNHHDHPDEPCIAYDNLLLIAFKQGATSREIQRLATKYRLTPETLYPSGVQDFRLEVNSELISQEIAEKLMQSEPIVAYAEGAWVILGDVLLETLPDPGKDEKFSDQWHLKNTGQEGGVVGEDIKASLYRKNRFWTFSIQSTACDCLFNLPVVMRDRLFSLVHPMVITTKS